jgi:ribokinase
MAELQSPQLQHDRPRIVVVGSINMDLVVRSEKLPGPGETVIGREVREIPGGKGANQAVAAARLGANVSMIARVGDDAFGEKLRAGLASEGIDVGHVVVTSECASGLAVVAVDDRGENAITVIPGANGRLTSADVRAAEDLIRAADVVLLQLEIPIETVQSAVSLSRQLAKTVILDPAPAPRTVDSRMLSVDVICPNETEATALTGIAIANIDDAMRAAARLREMGPTYAIITLGRDGAVVCGPDGGLERVASFAITPVDTTAAGDAFAAALGFCLARRAPIHDAVRFACAAGAVAASRPGAQPSMPTVGEVSDLLRTGSRPIP